MIKRCIYIMSTLLFVASSLATAPTPVGANSYPGGNWKLTFYSPVDHEDVEQEVYVVNPDGSSLVRVTSNQLRDANPQWSPSTTQRKIAFDRHTDDTSLRDIYVQDIDANGQPSGSATVLSGANTNENEWDPSWSPDGTTVAFHRRSTVGGSGPNHIFTIDSTGGTAVARTGGGAEDDDYRDTEPTWNRQGSLLGFTRTATSDDTTVIAVVAADGDESDVVTVPGSAGGSSPQFSPTSDRMVFQKGGEIWVYDAGATSAVQLTNGASIALTPTYSPDGRIIAASGNAGIAYYNAATGSLLDTVTIAANPSLGFDPANGIHEVDWARTASSPPSTTHECTTYVNENCITFTPEIPTPCQVVTTQAAHGTPKFENNAFVFTPETDYIGNDSYVYTYYDELMNAITCTVNITVLPRAPDAGSLPYTKTILYGALVTGLLIGSGTVARRMMHRRKY